MRIEDVIIGVVVAVVGGLLEFYHERRTHREQLKRPEDQLQIIVTLEDVYQDVTEIGDVLAELRKKIEKLEEKHNE